MNHLCVLDLGEHSEDYQNLAVLLIFEESQLDAWQMINTAKLMKFSF